MLSFNQYKIPLSFQYSNLLYKCESKSSLVDAQCQTASENQLIKPNL